MLTAVYRWNLTNVHFHKINTVQSLHQKHLIHVTLPTFTVPNDVTFLVATNTVKTIHTEDTNNCINRSCCIWNTQKWTFRDPLLLTRAATLNSELKKEQFPSTVLCAAFHTICIFFHNDCKPFNALILLARWQEGHVVCRKLCYNNSQKFLLGTWLNLE